MKLRILSLAAVALLASVAASAKAGLVDTATNGLNIYHDASRDFVDYANGTVGFQVGDTIVGFQQINLKESPNTVDITNTVYDLFSENVASISADGKTLTLQATPAANPFSLQSILAGSGLTIPDGTVAMILDTQSAAQANLNVLNNPPPGATNMQGYLQYLASAASGLKYDGAVGFAAGDNSFEKVTFGTVGGNSVVANNTYAGTPATATLLNSLPETVRTLATFDGGFSVLLNNTQITFNNNVIGDDLLPHQLILGSGVTSGGNTNPTYGVWGTPGFEDSVDIGFNATITPEPSSIVLFGVGFGGIFARYLRKRKKTAAV